ncbi:MAG: hypothetical protein JWN46_2435 [Acidimicrobiales bacterium]|nr:hypothetical protein [Acidimicrobiales bacterium]
MTITTTPIGQIAPLDRAEAAARAAEENERFADLLRSLGPDDWPQRTDCPDWDVRALASHVLGAMEANVSIPQFVHQLRAGKKAAGDRPDIDGMTEVQVRERADLRPDEIVAAVTTMAPKAANARRRVPAPLRRLPLKVEVAGTMERWRLGYLLDLIFTRDTWMHRVDVTRATGRPLVLTADHDGRIVADVVAEWARRHGQDVTLDLGGPAGGRFARGEGGEEISLDAVEFCRILSGRATGTGLLTQEVPF